MKKQFSSIAVFSLLLLITSCKKAILPDASPKPTEVPAAIKAKIAALGLTSKGAYKINGGYIAEGDIFLDDAMLNSTAEKQSVIVANAEHYHTTNLVAGMPRVITIRYNGSLTSVSNAINAAIMRYNALPLQLKFARVIFGGDIVVNNVTNQTYIAQSGFPSGGNPFNTINFNIAYANWNSNTLTTVLAHEMGHCIGFRHTDLACRQFSCGGSFVNEGDAGVGAIHIPGTPFDCSSDPSSWMLACIDNGTDRPFDIYDIIALIYLY